MAEKVSFQKIMEVLSNHMEGGKLAEITFGKDSKFPYKFHVEESDEGEVQILEEMGEKVLKYVSETRVIRALCEFTGNLSREEYAEYQMNHDKAKKVVRYWIHHKRAFRDKIYPVLSKSHKGYCFHRLDFDPEEMPTPTFDYLSEALDTNKKAFMAFIGAMLDPHVTLQQYLWISGNGGDGKGAIFRFLAKIFRQSYTSITTEQRHIDKYWQSQLVGKRVAVCGDTKNLDFINSSIFMQVTGGDHVVVRPMYGKAYTAELKAMFIFGANADPAVTTEDSSIRRAIICKLEREKYQHIDNFEEKLWEERAGIVKKCWEEWKEVKHLPRIPIDEASIKRLGEDNEEKYQQILDEYFDLGEGFEVSASRVITLTDRREPRPMTCQQRGAFKRWLKRAHGIDVGVKRVGGRNTKVYVGMKEKGEQVNAATEF